MPEIYKIDVNVNGAPSGSERLAAKQGETVIGDVAEVPKTKVTAMSKLEEIVGKERLNSLKKTVGTATAVGYVVLDFHEQTKSFEGDSNRVTRIGEGKRIAGVLGAAGTLTLTGNFVGAGLVLGYTALSLAKENRELINTAMVDSYSSTYYTKRLVDDKTKRSR